MRNNRRVRLNRVRQRYRYRQEIRYRRQMNAIGKPWQSAKFRTMRDLLRRLPLSERRRLNLEDRDE